MYAEKTSVPVGQSQSEIRKILTKYGATAFAFAESQTVSQIQFELHGKRIKFNLLMPDRPAPNATQVLVKKFEQACRSRWRSLTLAIKAKLECVEIGITTLEQEFLAHIVLPGGQTFGEIYIPQIAESYKNKKLPSLLSGGHS